MYTNLHLNKYWRLTQEAWVIVHSGVVAAQTGGDEQKGTRLWPRFVFGFSLGFVITQIFGLPFWRKLPTWSRFLPLLVYSAITLWAYSWIPDADGNTWVRLPEIFTIPSTFYIFFVYAYFLVFILLKLERKFHGKALPPAQKPLSAGKQVLYLGGALFIYAIHTALAVICEYTDWIAGLVVLMMGFTTIFMTGTFIAFMLLRRAIPLKFLREPEADDHMTKTKTKQTELNSNVEAASGGSCDEQNQNEAFQQEDLNNGNSAESQQEDDGQTKF